MFRALLVPLLIAGLLVCPLRCTSAAIVVDLDSAVRGPQIAAVVSGCSCCALRAPAKPLAGEPTEAEGTVAVESVDAAQAPAGCPAEGCGCSSCICSGAILKCDGDLLQAVLGDVVGERLSWISATDPAEGIAVSLANSIPPHSQLLNGRAARIAHQSLLI